MAWSTGQKVAASAGAVVGVAVIAGIVIEMRKPSGGAAPSGGLQTNQRYSVQASCPATGAAMAAIIPGSTVQVPNGSGTIKWISVTPGPSGAAVVFDYTGPSIPLANVQSFFAPCSAGSPQSIGGYGT